MTARRRALILWLGLLTSHVAESSAATDPVDAAGHRAFADALAKHLFANPNECSSALGVSMAFSLIYPGCTGDAIDQLRGALGYPAGSNLRLVWRDAADRMLSDFGGQCKGRVWEGVCDAEAPTLKIANRVWLDDGDELDSNYASVVGEFARQIDLGGDYSPWIINKWVKSSTNGLIESIVDEGRPLYPPAELIAINSIYLKASWRRPFDEKKTNLDSFYGTATREAKVSKAHFMNGVFADLPYSHDALSGHQVVRLPFASSKMSMILVLPLADGAGPVASGDLLPALGGLQTARVALSMPKFKFESTYDDKLKLAIQKTGITAPFEGGSLCGLFQSGRGCETLFVDKVVQKTVIDVHETGVEAAAATLLATGRSAPNMLSDPVAMVCDHPFQFFVHDEAEDLVLFEGRVGAPAIPDAEPAGPLLGSTHADGDFWSGAPFFVNPVDPPSNAVSIDELGYPIDGTDADAALDDAPSSRGFPSVGSSLVLGTPLGCALGLLM